jgi:hypothetical protein
MKRILISAYCKIHADYYAREVLKISSSQWYFINDAYRIRGQRGRGLIFVNAPRHRPSLVEMEKRDYLFETCLAWGIDIKRVELS